MENECVCIFYTLLHRRWCTGFDVATGCIRYCILLLGVANTWCRAITVRPAHCIDSDRERAGGMKVGRNKPWDSYVVS